MNLNDYDDDDDDDNDHDDDADDAYDGDYDIDGGYSSMMTYKWQIILRPVALSQKKTSKQT